MVLSTVSYAFFFAKFHIDPHHDGIILRPAVDVFHGQRLFVDTFTQYGALTTLIHVAFMRMFGPNLYAIRLSAVIFYGISAYLLYRLWKQFFGTRVLLVCFVSWLVMAYFPNRSVMVPFIGWSSVYALSFQLGTILMGLQYLERKRLSYLVLAGFFAAFTFWARQPVGIFLIGALFVFLFCRRIFILPRKQVLPELLAVTVGVVAISLPFLIWLQSMNAIPYWWEQSIRLAFNFGQRLSGSFSIQPILSTLFLPFTIKKNIWWVMLPLATVIALISRCCLVFAQRKRISLRTEKIIFLALISLASWLQYFPGPDPTHVYWAATPMIVLFFILLPQSIRFFLKAACTELRLPRAHIEAVTLACSICVTIGLLTPFIITDMKGIKFYARSTFVAIESPEVIRGMLVTPEESTVFTRITSLTSLYFSLYPQKYGLNLSPDALYSLIDPHMQKIHRAAMYWDWATEAVWPDLLPLVRTRIQHDRPLVLSGNPGLPPDIEKSLSKTYCVTDLSLQVPTRIQILNRPLFVHTPSEDVVTVTEDKGKVMITPRASDGQALIHVGKSVTILPLKRNEKTTVAVAQDQPFDIVVLPFGICHYHMPEHVTGDMN